MNFYLIKPKYNPKFILQYPGICTNKHKNNSFNGFKSRKRLRVLWTCFTWPIITFNFRQAVRRVWQHVTQLSTWSTELCYTAWSHPNINLINLTEQEVLPTYILNLFFTSLEIYIADQMTPIQSTMKSCVLSHDNLIPSPDYTIKHSPPTTAYREIFCYKRYYSRPPLYQVAEEYTKHLLCLWWPDSVNHL